MATNATGLLAVMFRFRKLSDEQRRAFADAVLKGELPNFGEPQGVPLSVCIPLIAGAVVAFFISKQIARPMEALSRAAEKLSNGDLSTRVEVMSRVPEFQITANTFNTVAASLERLEQERRAMIADIAHELRNPLTAIKTRLEGLQDGIVEFGPKEIERLQAQVNLLSRMVDDLRTLSLADDGQLSLQKRPIDLNDWLGGIAEVFGARAKAKNIGLILNLATTDTQAIKADPDRLAQVMNNLLENALRHTPEGGTIEISAQLSVPISAPISAQAGVTHASKSIKIAVQDSGSGIPQGAVEKIFDRFFRADPSRSRLSGGTGLGLAIARAIVLLHGGTIEAVNVPMSGARLSFNLPIGDA
jgi:two-component system, OmpR family, sensor histidine kinase BaeS